MGATMKLNISFPANGSQKLIEIEDDRKLRVFMDKRMGQEVPGDSVGDEFKGYIFKITGGNDKQGFPMKQSLVDAQVKHILFLFFGRSIIGQWELIVFRASIRKRREATGWIP